MYLILKILGLQANLLGANPGMAKSHAYWTRTLVILAFLIGWVEGEDVPSSCLECPHDFTLADGRCFSVKQQVLKREWQRITMSLVVQMYFICKDYTFLDWHELNDINS